METRERLLSEIEIFLKSEGVSASDFGRLALNDTAFVTRFRDGADVRLSTADKIRSFITDYKRNGTTEHKSSVQSARL